MLFRVKRTGELMASRQDMLSIKAALQAEEKQHTERKGIGEGIIKSK